MNEETRNEIVRLFYGGASRRRIARMLRVDRKTVARVLADHENRRAGVPPSKRARRASSAGSFRGDHGATARTLSRLDRRATP